MWYNFLIIKIIKQFFSYLIILNLNKSFYSIFAILILKSTENFQFWATRSNFMPKTALKVMTDVFFSNRKSVFRQKKMKNIHSFPSSKSKTEALFTKFLKNMQS